MGDTFVSKFGELSVRHDHNAHDRSVSDPGKINGDDDTVKNNPWKPIASTDNNALEAEAWPEPSAPTEHRRGGNARQFDEKPKRKIKWQNFEVDQSSYGLPRGRGRGSLTTHYGPVNTFRRGFAGFRNRVPLEINRGIRPNGYFPRHPNRTVSVRPTVGVGLDRSVGNAIDTTLPSSPGTQNNQKQLECSHSAERLLPENPRKEPNNPTEHPTETPTAASKYQQDVPNGRNVSLAQTVTVPKRSYRDRALTDMAAQSGLDAPTQTKTYETGPVGRARRSYLRQHQSGLSGEHDLPAQNTLPTNAAVSALFPFQPLPPFAYFIPAAPTIGAPLWGNSIQLFPSSSAQFSFQENSVSAASIGSQQSLVASVNSVATQVSSVSGTSLEPDAQLNAHPPSVLNHPCHFGGSLVSKPTSGGDVNVDVVDVNQMVEFLAGIGWRRVILPISLREHPVIASAIHASTGDSPLEDQRGSASDESVASNTKDESQSLKPMSKPDDVVIVDNQVFFVPRNVNRTKFLKFTSKLDYIRHHVEYYFSESNLNRDKHLAMILNTNEGVCPIPSLLLFNRLRWVSTTEAELLEAVANSQLLVVVRSADGCPYGICRFSGSANEPSAMQPIVSHTCQSDSTSPHTGPVCLDSDKLQQPTSSDTHSGASNRCIHSAELTIANNFPHSSVPNDAHHLPLIGAPTVAPQYAQPTVLVNPLPRLDVSNTTSGTHAFPCSAHAPQYFPFDLSGHQPTVAQPFAINHPPFYPPQQVAILAAAGSSHPGFISAPVTNGLHTTETNTAFLPTLYRIAPNQSSPALGTCLPQLSGPAAFPPTSNSTVLLQFLPSTQSPQTGGFVPSPQPLTASLLNRAVGPISPGGLWIPFPATSNSGSQPIAPVNHALLAFPSNQIVGPPGSLNAGTIPLHLPFHSFTGLPAQGVDFTHFGQSDQKWGENPYSSNAQQYYKNCTLGACHVPDTCSNSASNELVQSVGQFPMHSRSPLSHGSYSADSVLALESQTAASTRSTPKKNF